MAITPQVSAIRIQVCIQVNKKPSTTPAKAINAKLIKKPFQSINSRGPPIISAGLNTKNSGIKYKPLAKRQACILVSIVLLPAIAAAAKAAKATGGVTLESCEYQKTNRCATNSGIPNSTVKAGPTNTISTM